MNIIKPDNLSLLFAPFVAGNHCCISVAALVCFSLETTVDDRLLEEAFLWQAVAQELGEEALDMVCPKQRGEFLVYGACHSPQAVTGLQVSVSVGSITKTLNVSGEHHWNAAGAPTAPLPFREKRITWDKAFGGEGWEQNPVGRGFVPDAEGRIPLPQVQDPRHILSSPKDRPEPAGFNAINPFWPQRKRYLGKFDDAWLKNRWPHYPHDTDPEYFNSAPVDQRISRFFKGDEPLQIVNMHPVKAKINSCLPGVRARLFTNRVVNGKEIFTEIEARPETVWLLPGCDCGILLFRGVSKINDETMDEVTHLMGEWESMNTPPESLDYYHRKFLGIISPPPAEAVEPPPAAPPPPPPEVPKAAPVSMPEPPKPPPLPPEVEKMTAEANKLITDTEAKLEALLARMGVTREQAMQRVTPKQPPKVMDVEATEALAAKTKLELEQLLKKMGVTPEEAMKRVRPASPVVNAETVLTESATAFAEIDKALAGIGFSREQAIARVFPGAAISALNLADPLAPIKKVLASLPSPSDIPNEPVVAEAPAEAAPPPPIGAPLTVEQVMERYRLKESLRFLDLSGLDFTGLTLDKADFTSCIFSGALFKRASLSGVIFTGTVLVDADFTDAVLDMSHIDGAQAAGARFVGAELRGAMLAGSEYSGCNFSRADLADAVLDGSAFSDADFSGATGVRMSARNSIFTGANFTDGRFSESNLSGANLGRSVLDNASFAGITATGFSIEDATGEGADFSNALLVSSRAGAGTSLKRVNLSGADMRNACWEGAKLDGVKMVGACLDSGDFSRMVLDNCNMVNCVARRADMSRVVMNNCDIRGINLFKGNLRNSLLNGCDMRRAHLFGADLYCARFKRCDTTGVDYRRTITDRIKYTEGGI